MRLVNLERGARSIKRVKGKAGNETGFSNLSVKWPLSGIFIPSNSLKELLQHPQLFRLRFTTEKFVLQCPFAIIA